MLVREVMTTSPVTVRPTTTVQAAPRLVAEVHVTSLPVVDRSGRVLCMLSRSGGVTSARILAD
jgi:CBS domain-containing protein